MTQDEALELKIERDSLIKTINEMSKGDARINSKLNNLLTSLEQKVRLIDSKLESYYFNERF